MHVIDAAQVLGWTAVFGAGFLAGAINVMVGAGTLVSFPILVLLGHAPLAATIANTMGIVPASLSGVLVYRRELQARSGVVRVLLPASVAGGILGAYLLLHLDSGAFSAVVPWLIAVGTVLVILGPDIKKRVTRHDHVAAGATAPGTTYPSGSAFPTRASLPASVVGALLLGTYGGYFSAAQGILLIALLGITTTMPMQDLNAIKNLTVAAVNVIAASVFLLASPSRIEWHLVGLIAAGSALGGTVGGRFARRLRPGAFRIFVASVGLVTVVAMVLNH
ncbi:UPF0721 transmembrane protein [Tersicoccus solisilvae]|uniref:Probable membrane transporter protein n=1 Tax=Tersicoccus solisilvae TaxID=1882339 RepID=A0ABQ1PMD9_9MICC|nr:sulfite exporter TauE/SafE family protein [Tersicoccus solisilvae]GGC99483.1 UPF0721 transmembrane protein [Tersicoccus solisilvae]